MKTERNTGFKPAPSEWESEMLITNTNFAKVRGLVCIQFKRLTMTIIAVYPLYNININLKCIVSCQGLEPWTPTLKV